MRVLASLNLLLIAALTSPAAAVDPCQPPDPLQAISGIPAPDAKGPTGLAPNGEAWDFSGPMPREAALRYLRRSVPAAAGGPSAALRSVAPNPLAALISNPVPHIETGLFELPDRATFETMAFQNTTPGALALREVKFLITDVQGTPTFHFINTKNFKYHYSFATRQEIEPGFPDERIGLDLPIGLRAFNAQTYFGRNRNFIAGKIIAHDHHQPQPGVQGSYVLELWPTDNPEAALVKMAYDLAAEGIRPLADGRFFYHPTGEAQKETLADAIAADPSFLADASVDDESLFGNIEYSPATIAEGAGFLRMLDAGPPASYLDVVIMDTPAGDLPRVGGAIVTGALPTPLDHVSIISKGAPPENPAFPYAYIKDATNHADIAPLLGKWVLFKVGPNGFEMEETDELTVRAFHEARRPVNTTFPPWDETTVEIVNINDIGRADSEAYGSKASNAGELRNIPGRVFSAPGDANLRSSGQVSDSFAVPFTFYHQYMDVKRRPNGRIHPNQNDPDAKSLYEMAAEMQTADEWRARPNDPIIRGSFENDSDVRRRRLEQFKAFMDRRGTRLPDELVGKIEFVFDNSGGRWRVRSSASVEDLPNFPGAGLHDSDSGDADDISRSFQEVWASLWNYRAYNARDFSRLDHQASKMGLLIHRNFPDDIQGRPYELANFVAVTINPSLPGFPGFQLNIAPRSQLVTHGANSDKVTLVQVPPNMQEYTPIYDRKTTLLDLIRDDPNNPGQKLPHVMTHAELQVVGRALQQVHDHFAPLYGKQPDDPTYAMDVEGKLIRDRNGRLVIVIKQARPYRVPESGR